MEPLEGRQLLSATHPVQKLVLDDQFNNFNPDNWGVYNGWSVGRSEINVANSVTTRRGVINVNVSTYDPNSPGTMLTGGELDGKQSYALGGRRNTFEYRYVVRARFSSPLVGGLVGGMFMYSTDQNASHDELDFEPTTDQGILSGSKTIDTNVFRSDGTTLYDPVTLPPHFSFTRWNVYEIDWTTSGIKWYIGGKLIRTESYVAKSRMRPIINLWAAQSAWDTAYDSSLQPTANPALAKTYSLQLDYVQVWSLT